MVALSGALLLALLIVGTAALSGYPLPLIVAALAVGGVILAVMWRVRARSAARSADAADD
ncbi:hypothetical protein HC028_22850 [Planosporangium flavigriseum]|uniref:Uncharacterized protein n=1 Tax=Planosporangium flavigriseum TaxID=373681 RepID=A0A8J3LXY9_9ACTN|nr:hypothetical protein [Planosporangium flavigriseum]NJC67317.1 hypothetical protein [Planosporangium flavigriseum]GIG75400.1 hypothetical protein Pfl04_38040 [Planosporangium flavigriseum]